MRRPWPTRGGGGAVSPIDFINIFESKICVSLVPEESCLLFDYLVDFHVNTTFGVHHSGTVNPRRTIM